ncbi:phosphotransferase family protein [Nesterenkonia flava]|uniref:Aminoglycoside phosphotransferase domain-containing protein n=1 Tax=Nesterenkonia flava TaxID=469799 RepID=A0ABU1FR07_9MICC|nr:hypothetical protein [Nesterenkonia flava]MDR5711049.1 hypothetical protein [Nesterenkonia flava]
MTAPRMTTTPRNIPTAETVTSAPEESPAHTAAEPLPRELNAEGARWSVRRAWPDKHPCRLGVELGGLEADAAGQIRAGWWEHQQLALLPEGEDPKLPALAAFARRGDVVSHRPAKRAVVHEAETDSFIKIVRPGRAQGILDGITRAAVFEGPFRTPELIQVDDAARSAWVRFRRLEGVSLHSPEELPGRLWHQAWEDVLHAWEAAGRRSAEHTTAVHGVTEESQVLRHWAEQAAPLMTEGRELCAAAESLGVLLQELPQAPLRVSHRDLHDKQLLWSPKGPGLLDVDTAALADPALDLGNLRAHALLRHTQGLWSAEQAGVVVAAVDSAARSCSVPAPSLGVYEAAALLRLGCVYAFRPQYAPVAAQLRRTVHQVLREPITTPLGDSGVA